MFGFLKNLFRKPLEAPAESPHPMPAHMASAVAPAPVPHAHAAASISHAAQMRKNLVQQNGRGVKVPLHKILDNLPLELQPRVREADVTDLALSIPLEKVLAQLSRGVVKVTFGELRQAFPEIFTPEADRDRVLVQLPLADILSQLNPALISRRRVQRQVEVPNEVNSPFDPNGEKMILSVGPSKSEAEPAPAPIQARQTSLTPPTPIVPARHTLTSSPTPPPPAVRPPGMPIRSTPSSAPTFSASPMAPGINSKGRSQRDTNGRQPPASIPMPQPAKSTSTAELLIVGLGALSEAWPEAVRKEIVQLNLADAKVALPLAAVEQGLKQGRIAFPWKAVRSWIKPAVLPAVSAHDNMVLELPLKVVAPLFLTRQREGARPQQKISVDEEIPDLFFGFPQPESASPAPAPAPAKVADTNYYAWDESVEVARTPVGTSPGTRFTARYATPNEVVARAVSFNGVAGALIALPDGLMVANHLPPDLNAEMLAAFLAQIFGRVSQCTKELRMGELNNLNFTVGNVPWKIFRVKNVFFAAFGHAGQPLPSAQLATLAAELDHKPK